MTKRFNADRLLQVINGISTDDVSDTWKATLSGSARMILLKPIFFPVDRHDAGGDVAVDPEFERPLGDREIREQVMAAATEMMTILKVLEEHKDEIRPSVVTEIKGQGRAFQEMVERHGIRNITLPHLEPEQGSGKHDAKPGAGHGI